MTRHHIDCGWICVYLRNVGNTASSSSCSDCHQYRVMSSIFTEISFTDEPKRHAMLESLDLERLGEEVQWLKSQLDGETHGLTRAKEVGR